MANPRSISRNNNKLKKIRIPQKSVTGKEFIKRYTDKVVEDKVSQIANARYVSMKAHNLKPIGYAKKQDLTDLNNDEIKYINLQKLLRNAIRKNDQELKQNQKRRKASECGSRSKGRRPQRNLKDITDFSIEYDTNPRSESPSQQRHYQEISLNGS